MLPVCNHIKIYEAWAVNRPPPWNHQMLISTLRDHTSAVTHNAASACTGCNELIDVLKRQRRRPWRNYQGVLIRFASVTICSLPHGGYCAGLIENNTMLSGCFHWQTNFKTYLAAYLGCCALALFNSDFLSGCFQSPCAGFLCYFLPFTWWAGNFS